MNRVADKVQVMGILNVTPDSFYDGGNFNATDKAIAQALSMCDAGAAIIDIGGESTRPGAADVSVQDELNRVVPVIRELKAQSGVEISIDTSRPEVMQAAIDAGATVINDVRALQVPGALEMAASLDVPICLMHMKGQPRTMQANPHYQNVVVEVLDFLKQRVDICLAAGIKQQNIWLDPGFGFGKNLSHNLSLLKHLDEFVETGFPVLAGMSRKSMLGAILDREVQDRLPGSLALATIAVLKGVSILRVHDVRETVDVVKVCNAFMQAN